MKNKVTVFLLLSALFFGLSFTYVTPCGFWDGVTSDGLATGGQLICRGIPLGVIQNPDVAQGLQPPRPVSLLVNFLSSAALSAFVMFVLNKFKKKKS